jgi:hypothetical protein
MEERLNMSIKERDELHVVRNVLEGRLTQGEAAEVLRRSERQVRRLCTRVRDRGDRGLVHGLRGRPSNNQLDEDLLGQALSALHDPLWHDFKPIFCLDKLKDFYGIALSEWTVRRLMLLTGLWAIRRSRPKHRSWRPRRSCVGMLVQLDGSDHDWFEGRGPRCALIIYIDDATSRILHGEFAKVEDTLTLMRTTRTYLRRWGRPVAFYVDKDSIYSVNEPAGSEEKLRVCEPITQFTRAMTKLDIDVILAHSPQAKGRVERGFGTHQDRLVKELRLRGICTIEAANRYLRAEYIEDHNARCAVEPADHAGAHRRLQREHDLDAILSIQEDRQVSNDYTVRYDNRFFQLTPEQPVRLGPKKTVTVQHRLDGSLRIVFQGCYLRFRQIPHQPYRPAFSRRIKPRADTLSHGKTRRRVDPFYEAFTLASNEPTNLPASALTQ